MQMDSGGKEMVKIITGPPAKQASAFIVVDMDAIDTGRADTRW